MAAAKVEEKHEEAEVAAVKVEEEEEVAAVKVEAEVKEAEE